MIRFAIKISVALLPVILIACPLLSRAQSTVENVLLRVEQNNTTLAALRKMTDAEKIGNRTGLALQNPGAAFDFLWGSPQEIGNRTDIYINQSFDFPTVYAFKSQIASMKNEQAELVYREQRTGILHRAHLICIDLIFRNAEKTEYSKRYRDAQLLQAGYEAKLEQGEAGILELNKIRLTVLSYAQKLKNTDIELEALQSELAGLNGGQIISINDSIYTGPQTAVDFEQWYARSELKNPLFQWFRQELSIARKQEQLNFSQSLPGFQIGYMSEKTVGIRYQGITAGITVPLWENRNKVRFAKARSMAVQSMEADEKSRFFNEMKTLFNKANALKTGLSEYQQKFALLNDPALLRKALDQGEISLITFLSERSLYYQGVDEMLAMEHDLNILWARLMKYQL
ncbi:MAG: TolC family protein [Bacteroidales bacterium]|nr:TolC family protein [Bacteroidales bacterium]